MAARDDGVSDDDDAATKRQGRRRPSLRPTTRTRPLDSIPATSVTATEFQSFDPYSDLPNSDSAHLPDRTEVGEYIIEETIGAGGGGTVYAARHRALGHRVAIKVLSEELAAVPSMLARFVQEAMAVRTIDHPNIVKIYEFGHLSPSRPYYVMELLDGMDLRKFLQLRGRFSAAETLALMEPICSAVQAAHEAGFIHRDLKASNIFVTECDGERSLKLLDFGIAKLLQTESSAQGLTAPGTRLGTPHYMAPEQIRCEPVDHRADIYALGVLVHQLLTGEYPFQSADPRTVALLHLQSPAPRPSKSAPVSAALDAIVLRCLEKHPDRRFQSVAEFLGAFRTAQLGDAGAGSEPGAAATALGVYIEVQFVEEDSDDAFEDAGNLLEIAEQYLREREFVFPLRTSNALLGVRVSAAPGEISEPREQASVLLEELQKLCSQGEQPQHPGLRIAVSLGVGDVLCRHTPEGCEVLGGKLLDDVQLWPDRYWL